MRDFSLAQVVVSRRGGAQGDDVGHGAGVDVRVARARLGACDAPPVALVALEDAADGDGAGGDGIMWIARARAQYGSHTQ